MNKDDVSSSVRFVASCTILRTASNLRFHSIMAYFNQKYFAPVRILCSDIQSRVEITNNQLCMKPGWHDCCIIGQRSWKLVNMGGFQFCFVFKNIEQNTFPDWKIFIPHQKETQNKQRWQCFYYFTILIAFLLENKSIEWKHHRYHNLIISPNHQMFRSLSLIKSNYMNKSLLVSNFDFHLLSHNSGSFVNKCEIYRRHFSTFFIDQ